jgi:hypothetical protein
MLSEQEEVEAFNFLKGEVFKKNLKKKISKTVSRCQLVPAVQFPAAQPLLRY